jgi:hypothetical protein
VCHAPLGEQLRGRDRRVADRAAAASAWTIALASAGLTPENAAGSRAHTEGSGAALVGPKGTVLGVDLVSTGRVTPRHARAILDPEEWEALPDPLHSRAALGWGLKEAAAKALGAPARLFPAGLRFSRTPNGLEVMNCDEPRSSLVGYWETIGSLVCVWVLGISTGVVGLHYARQES